MFDESNLSMSYPQEDTNQLKSKVAVQEREIEKLKEKLDHETGSHSWNQSWVSVERDGRRLDRMIRMLEKKVKKCQDDEKIIKFCNAIGFLTSKKKEYQDDVLNIKEIIRANK